ncbi:hypothetical protein STEG23_019253 [Scotinomys teguina]
MARTAFSVKEMDVPFLAQSSFSFWEEPPNGCVCECASLRSTAVTESEKPHAASPCTSLTTHEKSKDVLSSFLKY